MAPWIKLTLIVYLNLYGHGHCSPKVSQKKPAKCEPSPPNGHGGEQRKADSTSFNPTTIPFRAPTAGERRRKQPWLRDQWRPEPSFASWCGFSASFPSFRRGFQLRHLLRCRWGDVFFVSFLGSKVEIFNLVCCFGEIVGENVQISWSLSMTSMFDAMPTGK